MVGLVVVSHSYTAAQGIAEIAAEMAGETNIEPVGGDSDGGIGTVPDDIEAALAAADDGDGVVVLVDLGSAVMNTEVAIELSDVETVIADAPVLEGAVNAAVAATSPDATLGSVRDQAESARNVDKL
ncbi:dihydroxyacetone kinase phosphoryl donor subunit DhaM [Haloarcula rubripromontorii]|uniref:phosphoenolpyruvate--glycerone phosphotransferase n=1 Tax=Haloarcula rubripromontorii TaxID=1705562 RepID=A0A0M9AJF0_9EURY|nr:dihydroxyacetone kinase phosphoryl donor subunit DhaM [Haloarcula rubripromontorii]KOX91861.1 PTS mannose transporter subunit IID [Haloarcula rubripromontorii]NLV06287.1 PTS-dependent dihydroxyacetone kinase phosphotransferase subunit DhaM [Haloarcula rubripromontorii]